MAKIKRILAVDVGGDSLKMAEFLYPESGGIVMEKFAFRRINSFEEGVNAEVFAENYLAMLAEHGFTADKVRLSISPQTAFVRLSKLPEMVGSKKSVKRLVEYEARQTVPYAIDEIEWDYQLLLHRYSERRTETQEDGSEIELTEEHNEFEALFVAMKRELISAYTDIITSSGKDILSVVIAPIPLYNAARGANQIAPGVCTMLLNIGSTMSTLVIADDQRVFLRNIPIAGYTLTTQIAKELGVPISEAEDLKCRYGFVALGGAYDEVDSELSNKISKISRNVMTRLHGEVSRSINVWRATHGGNAPQTVLLSGGGSTMPYLSDFFHEKLRLPVGYLNTFSAISLDPALNRDDLQPVAPMVQELIGLALSELPNVPLSLSLLPQEIKQQHDLDHRKIWFYASALVLLLCLGCVALGISKLSSHNEDLLAAHRGRVETTQAEQKTINNLMRQLGAEKGAFEKARNFLTERDDFIRIMAELQQITPDMMWYTSIEVEPAPGRGRSSANRSASGDAEKAGTPLERMAKLSSIGAIRLHGCALSMDGRNLHEQQLMEAVKNSKYFESVELITRHVQPDINLTGFEFLIKLKKPIQR